MSRPSRPTLSISGGCRDGDGMANADGPAGMRGRPVLESEARARVATAKRGYFFLVLTFRVLEATDCLPALLTLTSLTS